MEVNSAPLFVNALEGARLVLEWTFMLDSLSLIGDSLSLIGLLQAQFLPDKTLTMVGTLVHGTVSYHSLYKFRDLCYLI